MKQTIALLLLLTYGLISCGNDNSTSNPNPNTGISSDSTIVEQDENVHLLINYPMNIWQTDYIAFRIYHRENTRNNRSIFSYDEAMYKEAKSVGASCWNLVFYNTKTQDYYLLDSTKKMLIYEYELNDTAQGKVIRNIARYEVQFDDNNDQKFTNADAKRLFVSDRLGKFFHQVSPEGVSILHYEFAPKENFILIYGRKDTNNDGIFDEKDADTIYRLDMNQTVEKTNIAQPIFSKEFEKKLQKKIKTDWKLPQN